MKKSAIVILLFAFLIISCKPAINTTSKNNFEDCIEFIVNRINQCAEAEKNGKKAEFDFSRRTLIFYYGKSPDDYTDKWEIPLKELDEKTTISEPTSTYFSFQVYTVNMNRKIKHFGIDIESLSDQHNLYLNDYCFSNKERIKFINTFKRAIVLSKE
jgi:hypothetical protein